MRQTISYMRDSDRSSRPTDSTRPPAAPGRRVYGAVVTFYVILFFLLIWPLYPRAATIEPRILAMPHSLAYVVGGLLLSFFVLLGLYWKEHGGGDD
jgi:hypothetical protein